MPGYIPEIQQTDLPGGLRLLGVEYDRVPWVSLTFMVKRGAEADPPGKAGVADWTAEFLTLGTRSRGQLELAQDIENRGASLQAQAVWDATTITLEGLAEDFPELMATLAEVVQTPAFPEAEFPLLKERRRAELAHLLDNPREFASSRFRRLFFKGAPYGHSIRGDLEELADLGLEDLRGFYQREFAPQVASLVVVGMVPFRRVAAEAGRLFAPWPGGGPPSPAYSQAPANLCPPGIYLLDRPEATQSEIRLGHLGLPRSHPDYFPLRLMNYILGEGGFSSRLMSRIRSDLGFTYGIRSSFSFLRAPGPFLVSTFTPAKNTAGVVAEIKGVMAEVREQGVRPQELEEAISYFTGHFPLGLETPRALAHRVLAIDLYDLGRDYLQRYCEQVRQVTLKAAAQVARDHLHPEALVALVVGPADQCAGALAQLGPLRIITKI